MNGDIVGLSVLHSLSLVCGVLLLAFNVYVIVYEKDDRSDRRKTVPMRWRTITAASFSCGIHITSLCGVVEGIYQTSEVGERPVGLCEFQSTATAFCLSGFSATSFVIGLYNVEKMLNPLATVPRPLHEYYIMILTWTLIPTSVTIAAVVQGGGGIQALICWPSAAYANVVITVSTTVAMTLAVALNASSLLFNLCRKVKSNRYSRLRRCKKSQSLIRFVIALFAVTSMLIVGDGETSANSTDFAISLLGFILIFAWNRGVFGLFWWLFLPMEHKPKFFILPKYLKRYNETRANRKLDHKRLQKRPRKENKAEDRGASIALAEGAKGSASGHERRQPPITSPLKDAFSLPLPELKQDCEKRTGESKQNKVILECVNVHEQSPGQHGSSRCGTSKTSNTSNGVVRLKPLADAGTHANVHVTNCVETVKHEHKETNPEKTPPISGVSGGGGDNCARSSCNNDGMEFVSSMLGTQTALD